MRKLTKKSLTRKRLIILGILLILALSAVAVLRAVKGPAVGEVYRPSTGETIGTQSYIEVDGDKVIFNYPEEYSRDPAGKKQPNVFEYYTFKKTGGNKPGNLTLAISVYKLSASKLEEDGAFRLRKEQTENYQSRLSSINNYPFTIFKKKDGSETTAFTQNKDVVATISMSGSMANTNQSEAELTAILNSWQWK